ncbi:TetR/AcrR family transcriptional regulator [Streptomyces fuscichromogenes]|uniref:HTH tetR-type domain-containing protein n=1 Tax=Streptomyces fuscichromogenes TaxID=1324013 RepID=A0A917XG67_9ACTN|nr:TetR/AcrR family transcriptional regulator [Streptomyces fuscichromogenes]GGN22771.1 hypothetical protein GCM10011578_054670 [Streptomyces fuscichromogenes]
MRSAAKARSRQALLDAARELAAKEGYQACSVDAVATLAGLTSGAIYSIFGGKRQLFAAALADYWVLPSLHEVAEPGAPLQEVMYAYGQHYGEFMSGPLAVAAIDLGIEDVAHRRKHPQDDQHNPTSEISRFAAELSEYADAAGETLPLAPEELATVIDRSLGGLALARLQTNEPAGTLFGYVAASLMRGPA